MAQTGPVRTRPAGVEDAEFLISMLLHAVNWDSGRAAQSRAEVLSTPALEHYVSGWPRRGDIGVVAIDEVGERAGAAWLRQFTADDPAYGYVDGQTPELSVGVRAEYRGRGVGTELCRELLESADTAGIAGVSLSVEKANPAIGLYSRLGFVVIRDDGDSVTMLRGS